MLSRMGLQLKCVKGGDYREEFCVPVIIVNKIAKAGGIDDGQVQTDTILLDV